MRPPAVRRASAADAAVIAEIFREGIEDRGATFETRPPSATEIAPTIAAPLPMLVAERDGRVVGWAKVAAYDPVHDYYAGVGEATIYVARDARG